MEHTHNYDDGSEQMPIPLPDLDDIIRGASLDGHRQAISEAVDSARPKLLQTLTELRASNKRKFEEMVAMGLQPAPTAIVMARVEQLIDMILDEDERIGFDLGFEARMAEILDDGVKEGRRQQLTADGPHMRMANGNGGPPGGLFLP